MKENVCSLLLVLLVFVCCSGSLYAQQFPAPQPYVPYYWNYVVLKGGIFSPQGDVKQLDTGFNGELAYGLRFSRFAALEIGSGYFDLGHADRSLVARSNVSLDGDMYAIPFTIALKAILPLGRFELYGLGGGGGYYVHANGTVQTRFGRRSEGFDTVVAGGFLGAGITYNFTRAFFLGLEGKYLWTSNPDFEVHDHGQSVRTDFNIEGVQATVNVGYRF